MCVCVCVCVGGGGGWILIAGKQYFDRKEVIAIWKQYAMNIP